MALEVRMRIRAEMAQLRNIRTQLTKEIARLERGEEEGTGTSNGEKGRPASKGSGIGSVSTCSRRLVDSEKSAWIALRVQGTELADDILGQIVRFYKGESGAKATGDKDRTTMVVRKKTGDKVVRR
jgi:hypothetical protein